MQALRKVDEMKKARNPLIGDIVHYKPNREARCQAAIIVDDESLDYDDKDYFRAMAFFNGATGERGVLIPKLSSEWHWPEDCTKEMKTQVGT